MFENWEPEHYGRKRDNKRAGHPSPVSVPLSTNH